MRDARLSRILGIIGVLLLMPIAVPVGTAAQATNTIQLVIEGGAAPGFYDVSTDAPCRVGETGPGDWAIDIDDTGTLPQAIHLVINPTEPESDYLVVQLPDGGFYQSGPDPGVATLDDRGGSATLTLTLADMWAGDAEGTVPGANAVVALDCQLIERLEPFGSPPPASVGPPPEPTTWTGPSPSGA